MEQRVLNDPKYQKLAAEYAKIRAHASVLKKAVLDEQAKGATLRDQLRQKETALRRSEQEIDSLGFRNKQLEHRVAVLQEDIAETEARLKNDKKGHNKFSALLLNKNSSANKNKDNSNNDNSSATDALIFEELQRKIMESAHLTSLIEDKDRDLLLHTDRINHLEHALEQRSNEFSEFEKRLRRDIEILQSRNAQLEAKYEGATSLLGSEDALSNTGSENTTYMVQTELLKSVQDEKICALEREVAHWRAQFEVAKLTKNENDDHNNTNTLMQQTAAACCCSTSAAGIVVTPSEMCDNKRNSETPAIQQPPSPNQILHNRFSQKYEQLLKDKLVAESKLNSYNTETQHLLNCLENATYELKAKEEQMQSISSALRMMEDDLTTTRINYEEQISVLTEQVISLSEQLAASK